MDLALGLRVGMRRLASGVCVICSHNSTARYAMTASSVTSLSDNPPSLLVCVNKSAAIHPLLKKGQAFSVNVLARADYEISDLCAQPNTGEERFQLGQWGAHEQYGTPFLETALATFFCQVDNEDYGYGTHQIVIGRLLDTWVSDGIIDPLIYVDGQYQ